MPTAKKTDRILTQKDVDEVMDKLRKNRSNTPTEANIKYNSNRKLLEFMSRDIFTLHRQIARLCTKYDNVLDAGCGSLSMQKHFAIGTKFTNVDIVNRPGNSYKVDMSRESLPFRNNEFDIAIMAEVMEHLENPWFATRELKRVSKHILITTPSVTDLRNRLIFLFRKKFYHFFVPDELDSDHIFPVFPKQLDYMRNDWELLHNSIFKRDKGQKHIIQVWRKPNASE